MSEQKVVVIPDGKICDYIDGKFRNDTPEEYVRQTIEKRLVNEHKYLPSQIKVEYVLQVGSRKPRADIVIWDRDVSDQSQGNAKLIIECKKETVDAGHAKDGIGQLQWYWPASVVYVCLPELRVGHVDEQRPEVCVPQSGRRGWEYQFHGVQRYSVC